MAIFTLDLILDIKNSAFISKLHQCARVSFQLTGCYRYQIHFPHTTVPYNSSPISNTLFVSKVYARPCAGLIKWVCLSESEILVKYEKRKNFF